MAISGNNTIGEIDLVSIMGQPTYPAKQTQAFARDGVDGNVVAETGTRGKPFVARTSRDYATIADAHDGIIAYQALIGMDPIEVIWHGTSLLTKHSCKYIVLDVVQVDLHPCVGTVGGLVDGSLAMLTADWILLPIVANPPEGP